MSWSLVQRKGKRPQDRDIQLNLGSQSRSTRWNWSVQATPEATPRVDLHVLCNHELADTLRVPPVRRGENQKA
eukprot:3497108-Amphidinium_carterae.1